MKQFYLITFLLFLSFSYGQKSSSESDISGFKLYPNPVTSGKVYINTQDNAAKRILVFDVLGTQVLEATILDNELNVSRLDAGIYVLRVYENNKVATRKLIIK